MTEGADLPRVQDVYNANHFVSGHLDFTGLENTPYAMVVRGHLGTKIMTSIRKRIFKIVALCTLVSFMSVPTKVRATECSGLAILWFFPKYGSHPLFSDFKAIMKNYFEVDLATLQLNRALRWSEVRPIDELHSLLTKLKSDERLAGFLNELEDDVAKIFWDDKSRLAWQKAVISGPYKPTEYEMKSYMINQLKEINAILPPKLKFPIPAIRPSNRIEWLTEEAKKFHADYVPRFEKTLKDTLGMTFEEYEEKLAETTQGEFGRKLTSGEFEVIIQRRENARWWFPRVGLQNLRVTGSSDGGDDTVERNDLESKFYDVEVSPFSKRDPEAYPQYGFVRFVEGPEEEQTLRRLGENKIRYGTDRYIINPKIYPYITMFLGDSKTLLYNRTEIDHFRYRAIPFRYLSLLANHIYDMGEQNISLLAKKAVPLPEVIFRARFIEAHIMFPIRPDNSMITGFEFTDEPPSPEFAAFLTSQNIKIWDAREKTHRKPWSPDTPK